MLLNRGKGAFGTNLGGGGPTPPEGFAFVTDNNGNYLLDNSGKYIITETA